MCIVRHVSWLFVLYVAWTVALPNTLAREEVTSVPEEHADSQSDVVHLLNSSRIVDLTYPFDRETIYWPTEKGFKLVPGPAGITERGYYYSANRFIAAEHGGTHIDAPIHFFQDRDTVDEVPLEKLIGTAAVVDVSVSCARDRDYQVSIEDLRRWETDHGRQLVDVIVLLRTGFGNYWKDRKKLFGHGQNGARRSPGLAFSRTLPRRGTLDCRPSEY